MFADAPDGFAVAVDGDAAAHGLGQEEERAGNAVGGTEVAVAAREVGGLTAGRVVADPPARQAAAVEGEGAGQGNEVLQDPFQGSPSGSVRRR